MFINIQQVQNHIKPSPHVETSTEISCANPMVSPWAWLNHGTSVPVTREDSVLDVEEAGLMVRLCMWEKHVYEYIPLHLEEVYHT